MKIGFLLLRDTFFKTMGSLIKASLERGHHAVLLYDEGSVCGAKAYQQVTKEKLSTFQNLGAESAAFDLKDIAALRQKYELDVLVTHEGYYVLQSHLKEVQELRRAGTRVISLAHFFENIRAPLDSLLSFDKTYYLSRFAEETHFALYGDRSSEGEQKYAGLYEVTGSPMFDQLNDLDPGSIRAEYGIPSGKKVVLFFAPVVVSETHWRFYMWSDPNKLKRLLRIVRDGKWEYLIEALIAPTFQEIVASVRAFCVRNNALLIVKSRAKQRDPEYLKTLADVYIPGADDAYFPVFTSYKLLSIADVCINVMSMSVAEGVALNVPALNLHIAHQEYQPPSPHFYTHENEYFEAVMNVEGSGPFTCPGCITNIDRRKILDWLEENNLSDLVFDKTAAGRYREYFLGISDRSSSERILNSLDTMGAPDELSEVGQ